MALPNYKRKALETRLSQLLEEYEAVNDQLGRTLSEADRIRLRRHAQSLEREIEQVQRELESPSTTEPVTTSDYDPAVVRDLLLAAFTAQNFRRLFLYASDPGLKLLTQEFSPNDGLSAMVDKAIEHCQTRDLFRSLLREVEQANPRLYARFESRLYS